MCLLDCGFWCCQSPRPEAAHTAAVLLLLPLLSERDSCVGVRLTSHLLALGKVSAVSLPLFRHSGALSSSLRQSLRAAWELGQPRRAPEGAERGPRD